MTLQVAPYSKASAITKSDTVNIRSFLTQQVYPDAIYVGGAGVMVVVLQDDTTVDFTCVAGQTLPIKAKRINSTNTTATLMVALYY